MKKLYFLLFLILITSLSFGQTVFINEIHYDNAGGDVDEGIEIAGPTGTDLSTYTITAYNGSNGTSYNTTSLSGTIPDEGSGYGAVWFAISGLQNGAPDAIALDNNGTLIQFLSYEGSFIGSGGVADGITSEDIGVSETSGTAIGESLQLGGTGTDYTNFSWNAPAAASINLINPGQTFGTPVPTLTIPDAPASGGVLTTTPEAPNDATIDFTTTNFTVAVPSTGDGYIKWNVKDVGSNIIDSGDIFTTDGTETPVTGLVAGNTYTLFAELVDNSGTPISPAVEYTLTVIIPTYTVVADIAALRTDVTTNGVGDYYEITGAVLVSHTDGFNDRQWVQDSNITGILITEEGAEADIPFYNVGDNVTGLKGGTDESNGLLRFLPTTDSGVVASTGSVTPQLVTISDFNTNYADYESELVELQNVTFDAADGVTTFSTGTNYNVSDVIPNTVVMRTDYFGADYIGTVIPSDNITSLVAIAGRFNTTGQIYARSLSDLTLNSKYVEIEGFEMYPNPTNVGYINISSGSNYKIDVSIYSILGRQIISENVNNNRLDISSLKSGVYLLKAQQDNAITTKKLVIQ